MSQQPKCGRTPMPSVRLDLGKYVTLRPRADGGFRVYFQVPARLRPRDWPSLIPLPIHGARTGNLKNPDEVHRIQIDAALLFERLRNARLGREEAPSRTVKVLIRAWQESSSWKALKPRTHKHYGSYVNHILTWSATCTPADPDPATFTRKTIEDMLAIWDDAPTTKKHVRKTMRLVMDQAKAMEWRTDNPCDGIRIKGATTKALIWEATDVDAYAKAAVTLNRPSLELVIRLEWEIGQRLADVRRFRPGVEYADGVFRFHQSKTDSWVTIPVSEPLKVLLAQATEDPKLFLFLDERTGKAYTEERLSRAFMPVRDMAVKGGARPLLLKWLRHSCVIQLARAGCTVPEIAAITGHTLQGVERILQTYLPRDNAMAWAAQTRRGLIVAERR